MSTPPTQPNEYAAPPPAPNQPGIPSQAPVAQPGLQKKKSRTGLIVAVVVVIALIVGFLVVDRVVKSSAESSLREDIITNSEVQWEGLTTSFSGFPFLTQTMSGNYKKLDVHADSIQLDSETTEGRFNNVNATLTGIKTGDKTTVDHLVAQGFMAFADFPDTGDLGENATITGCDSNVCLQGTVDGMTANLVVSLHPSANGRGFTMTINEISIDGVPDILTQGLVGQEQNIPMDPLPAGLNVSDIVIEDNGILLKFEGTGVDMSQFEKTDDTDN